MPRRQLHGLAHVAIVAAGVLLLVLVWRIAVVLAM